jgi:uncharacterized membrane protein YphA (DoxX/SURF4 family)
MPAVSRGRMIAYWLTTLLVVFVFVSGGVFDLLRPQQVVEIMTRLGYPVYVCVILGVWKILGGIALVLPGTPRLKEWAYAGIFFDLTGAAASHFAVADAPSDIVSPLVIALVAAASWALRPPRRRLLGTIF